MSIPYKTLDVMLRKGTKYHTVNLVLRPTESECLRETDLLLSKELFSPQRHSGHPEGHNSWHSGYPHQVIFLGLLNKKILVRGGLIMGGN
jgi:hypothetical protein